MLKQGEVYCFTNLKFQIQLCRPSGCRASRVVIRNVFLYSSAWSPLLALFSGSKWWQSMATGPMSVDREREESPKGKEEFC